jgi:hypothetical protein
VLGAIGPSRRNPVDIRIGVTQAPREVNVELSDDTDRAALQKQIAAAVADGSLLTLADRKGREVMIPGSKIAYVELGTADAGPRIGFGA